MKYFYITGSSNTNWNHNYSSLANSIHQFAGSFIWCSRSHMQRAVVPAYKVNRGIVYFSLMTIWPNTPTQLEHDCIYLALLVLLVHVLVVRSMFALMLKQIILLQFPCSVRLFCTWRYNHNHHHHHHHQCRITALMHHSSAIVAIICMRSSPIWCVNFLSWWTILPRLYFLFLSYQRHRFMVFELALWLLFIDQ